MTTIGHCRADGCKAAEGGACIEGFSDLKDCPNFSESAPVADSKPEEIANSGVAETDAPSLEPDDSSSREYSFISSGNALTAEEAHALTGSVPSTLVLLAGDSRSGKTTAMAEVYESYRNGGFSGHLFAGSRTLIGFERICHYARQASELREETTERTLMGAENNLLHLDLVQKQSGRLKRLLVTDIQGEVFREAADSDDLLQKVPYLRRADHIVFFADCKKLSDPAERQVVLSHIMLLVRSCAENDLVNPKCKISIAFSRHDLFQEEGVGDEQDSFQRKMKKNIAYQVKSYFDSDPVFLDLAARPANEKTEPYGLDELTALWLADSSGREPQLPRLAIDTNLPMRHIDSFAFKGDD